MLLTLHRVKTFSQSFLAVLTNPANAQLSKCDVLTMEWKEGSFANQFPAPRLLQEPRLRRFAAAQTPNRVVAITVTPMTMNIAIETYFILSRESTLPSLFPSAVSRATAATSPTTAPAKTTRAS